MDLLNYTRPYGSWLPGLKAESRDELFSAIIRSLCTESFYKLNPKLTHEDILSSLIAREAQRSTAVGELIAFPHARLDYLAQPLFAVATLPVPVDFDGQPVRIVCLILSPLLEPTVSLKVMAKMTRIFLDPTLKESVLAATQANDLFNLFEQCNPNIDKSICASDIMRAPRWSISPETTISTCSHLMSQHALDVVPVVDENGRIQGEVSTDELFRYGLPEFFSKLKSVSFIAEFDPFQKYFTDERNALVITCMNRAVQRVPMEYTIMEIVFDLAIKKYHCLYVIDDAGRWLGSIDRSTVLDNVINH